VFQVCIENNSIPFLGGLIFIPNLERVRVSAGSEGCMREVGSTRPVVGTAEVKVRK
jgi:hypothetical protein